MIRVGLVCVALLGWVATAMKQSEPRVGHWRAWLDSPGGELPFGLELERQGDQWRAWLTNGPERIVVPRVIWREPKLTLAIDHYDSTIVARVNAEGTRLDGTWVKTTGPENVGRLPFHAAAGDAARFARSGAPSAEASSAIDGRWSVRFASDDDPAVGVFHVAADGAVNGTFMTTTGDYRYLAGAVEGSRLRLSCFDGAHAFLFDARLQRDGTLKGDFWSRDTWHDTWTARRDPTAKLPDDFAQTRWIREAQFDTLPFLDLDGELRTVGDPAYAGKARIVVIFGSWCPNCHDATDLLLELYGKYRARGLSIVGIAFELTGDFDRDAYQVHRYAKRHGVTYPLLIGGTADKRSASRTLPVLDKLRSYPTTIFMDADGRVEAVHTGFTGPATGQAYTKLRARFESIIEKLLAGDKK